MNTCIADSTSQLEGLDDWVENNAITAESTAHEIAFHATPCWELALRFQVIARAYRFEKEALNTTLISVNNELVITRKEVLDLRKQVSDLRVNTNNTPPPGSWSWHQCCFYGVIGLESGSRVLRLDDKYRPVTCVIKKTYTVIKNRIGKPKKAIPAELLPVERISSTTACIGMPITPPTPPPYPL